MSTRRIPGAMAGFLGTYGSRHSDHDGYWLFGFFVDAPRLVIDLLAEEIDASAPAVDTATRLARLRFADQLRKARIDLALVTHATVSIETTDAPVPTSIVVWPGSRALRIRLEVTLKGTRTVARDALVFAAPHDPSKALRSLRR